MVGAEAYFEGNEQNAILPKVKKKIKLFLRRGEVLDWSSPNAELKLVNVPSRAIFKYKPF